MAAAPIAAIRETRHHDTYSTCLGQNQHYGSGCAVQKCPVSNVAAPLDMAYRLPVLIAAGPPATEEFMTMLPLPDASSRGYASCIRNLKFGTRGPWLSALTALRCGLGDRDWSIGTNEEGTYAPLGVQTWLRLKADSRLVLINC